MECPPLILTRASLDVPMPWCLAACSRINTTTNPGIVSLILQYLRGKLFSNCGFMTNINIQEKLPVA